MKIRQADKVFFQFFEIFLNGQNEPVVQPDPRLGAFYRISLQLPRKKLKFFWGGNLGLSWPPHPRQRDGGWAAEIANRFCYGDSGRSEGSRNRSTEQTKDTARLTDLGEILHLVQDDSALGSEVINSSTSSHSKFNAKPACRLAAQNFEINSPAKNCAKSFV